MAPETPTSINHPWLDRLFATRLYAKLPRYFGWAALAFFLLGVFAFVFELGPLRNALLLGVGSIFCFLALCVLREPGVPERERLASFGRVLGGSLLVAIGLMLFMPGSPMTWDKRVRGTAPKLVETERGARLNEYFRSANKGASEYKGGTAERNVSDGLRKAILRRDKQRCLICERRAREEGLEVDHSRALMNGGSNEPENLAVLCVPCHLEKTAMDKSLRRFRGK